MQHDGERRRHMGAITRRDDEQAVAAATGAKPEGLLSGALLSLLEAPPA